MQTSCFGRCKEITIAGLEPVGIARGTPKWFSGRNERRLAPTWKMLKMAREEYDTAFAAILSLLDPQKMWDAIGENAVMLCWEKPGEWCHRRIVAEWFESRLGVEVEEFNAGDVTVRPYKSLPAKLR